MFNRSFLVDTPKGRGKLIRYYYHPSTHRKMVKVSFRKVYTHKNKRGKTITKEWFSVRNFRIDECKIYRTIPWYIKIWKGLLNPMSSIIEPENK